MLNRKHKRKRKGVTKLKYVSNVRRYPCAKESLKEFRRLST